MCGMFAAETAIFVHFKPVGGVFLVFNGGVIALLALLASQHYISPCAFNSHFGTSFL
jgi:hypothetical protein